MQIEWLMWEIFKMDGTMHIKQSFTKYSLPICKSEWWEFYPKNNLFVSNPGEYFYNVLFSGYSIISCINLYLLHKNESLFLWTDFVIFFVIVCFSGSKIDLVKLLKIPFKGNRSLRHLRPIGETQHWNILWGCDLAEIGSKDGCSAKWRGPLWPPLR